VSARPAAARTLRGAGSGPIMSAEIDTSPRPPAAPEAKPPAPAHALTIDVEDWYHVENLTPVCPPERWDEYEARLPGNLARMLDVCDEAGVRTTCFVLGRAAERHPEIVREIVDRGHELACHGWSHELIYRQEPAEFREETVRAKKLLEDLGGIAVHGYRASTFSIVESTLWALDVLHEAGFRYDSSVAPVEHDRYGIPGAPAVPHRRKVRDGEIVEFPVCTMRGFGRTFPLGGGFFRLFPLAWARRSVAEHEARGRSAMVYLHPWEIDPGQPRAKGLKWSHRFRHYARLGATEGKLRRLLSAGTWDTMGAILDRLAARADGLPVVGPAGGPDR